MDNQTIAKDADASSKTIDEPIANNAPKKRKGNPEIAKHGFKKGRSGNPNGRPKKDYDAARAAEQYAPACLDLIARIALTETTVNEKGEIVAVAAKPETRLAAANIIVERAHGKPIQQNKTDLTFNYAAQIDELIRRIEGSRELKVIDHE